MFELLTFVIAVMAFVRAWSNRREINRIDNTIEELIDALMEDAEADYEERITKMFEFLTEDIDPEEGA